MACSVVCISGAMGAGAAEAATIAAERLGFRVIDEEILVRAAALAGVDPHVVADVEQRRSLLGRLLQGVSSAADASALTFGGLALPPDEAPATDDLRGLIRTAIQEAADEGRAVIVAHAASLALASRDDVLRVLVTASTDVRQRRYADRHEVSEAEAAKEIAFSDHARADYFKRFYRVPAELPTHYDLVVCTDRLTAAAAADLIVAAAGA
jgi:cytidylate kinase